MRKGGGGSALARVPVGLLGARGFHFRHAQGPFDTNRAVRVKIKVIIASCDWTNHNAHWHSLLAVSRDRGSTAIDSVFRLGSAPPQAGIARCQRTKSTKRANGRRHRK